MELYRLYCPICGEKHDLKKLFERKFAVDTQLFPFESYDIMFCKKCGMIYAGNIDSNRGWNEYYSDTSKYENVNMSVPLSTISKYKIEMDIFQKYLSINTRVIDIGCGNGKMLSLMREGGFKHLTGVEISKKNIEFINTCYGIPAYVGDLEHLDALGDNKFQLVILNGVLEHVLNLQASIANVLQYIVDGGYVFLAVPALEQFIYYTNLYQQFSSEHVNYFSKISLKNLLERYGLELCEYRNALGTGFSLWKKTKVFNIKSVCFDRQGEYQINKYLSNCHDLFIRVKRRLMELGGNQKLYIWGAGTHTAVLFQLGVLDDFDVMGIVDANINFTDYNAYGHKIIFAGNFRDERYPILISSQYSQNEIEIYIRNNLKLKNQIIKLYTDEEVGTCYPV